MATARKRLQLNRETLVHLLDAELAQVKGGITLPRTLWKCKDKCEAPQPAPPPPPTPNPNPSGGTCMGYGCTAGTLKSQVGHCTYD